MYSDTSTWFALAFYSDLDTGEMHDLVRKWRGGGRRLLEDLLKVDSSAWASVGFDVSLRQCLESVREALPKVAEELEQCAAANHTVLTCDSPLYPANLAAAMGQMRPPVLFCEGDTALLNAPCVSLIGSREARETALEFTEKTVQALAARHITIATGFPEGIDRCALNATLRAGGEVVLVLARGLQNFSASGEKLVPKMDENKLAVISPFPTREEWSSPNAQKRNSLVVSLGAEVIVPQATPEGGSLEGARLALQQSKRVWSLSGPGPAHEKLIGAGALPVEYPSEQFDAWMQDVAESVAPSKPAEPQKEWTEKSVLEMLRRGKPEDIASTSRLPDNIVDRIVSGRKVTSIHTLNDITRIRGFDHSTVQAICKAYHLKPPPAPSEKISLFPDMEDFFG